MKSAPAPRRNTEARTAMDFEVDEPDRGGFDVDRVDDTDPA